MSSFEGLNFNRKGRGRCRCCLNEGFFKQSLWWVGYIWEDYRFLMNYAANYIYVLLFIVLFSLHFFLDWYLLFCGLSMYTGISKIYCEDIQSKSSLIYTLHISFKMSRLCYKVLRRPTQQLGNTALAKLSPPPFILLPLWSGSVGILWTWSVYAEVSRHICTNCTCLCFLLYQ